MRYARHGGYCQEDDISATGRDRGPPSRTSVQPEPTGRSRQHEYRAAGLGSPPRLRASQGVLYEHRHPIRTKRVRAEARRSDSHGRGWGAGPDGSRKNRRPRFSRENSPNKRAYGFLRFSILELTQPRIFPKVPFGTMEISTRNPIIRPSSRRFSLNGGAG